jgi:hypothetical protein
MPAPAAINPTDILKGDLTAILAAVLLRTKAVLRTTVALRIQRRSGCDQCNCSDRNHESFHYCISAAWRKTLERSDVGMDRKTLFGKRFSKWDPVQISCDGLPVERTPTPISPISALKSAVLGREGGFSFADLQHPPTVNPLSFARLGWRGAIR